MRTYDDTTIALLARCWAILDGPSGKRRHPALPDLLANLDRHGRLTPTEQAAADAVLHMSPATIDRRLAPTGKDSSPAKASHTPAQDPY